MKFPAPRKRLLSNARGLPGGMLKFLIDRYIISIKLTLYFKIQNLWKTETAVGYNETLDTSNPCRTSMGVELSYFIFFLFSF